MTPFTTLESVGAPIPQSDVDTDAMLPARFLLLMTKKGLGEKLFSDHRRSGIGERFVLDQHQYAGAKIIVAGRRFGIGSSREQAVWALHDFGIRCIIAESFGEIFFANCVNNGILPVALPSAELQPIMEAARVAEPLKVDLVEMTITLASGALISFDLDADQRETLLSGRDATGSILDLHSQEIAQFETTQKAASPWLWLDPEQFHPVTGEPSA